MIERTTSYEGSVMNYVKECKIPGQRLDSLETLYKATPTIATNAMSVYAAA